MSPSFGLRLLLLPLLRIALCDNVVAPPEPVLGDALDKINKKQDHLPPCQACRNLVKSFERGLEKTSRGKFEGGDASWEESRLGSYTDSEVRLVEIQEGLCSDVEKNSQQCHRLAEEYEQLLEEWWFHKKDHPDLHQFLCIDKANVCCPENHFGPDCKPCTGGAIKPCGGRGKCKGAGTRKGSGECKCDAGYTGEQCNKCDVGYYETSKEDEPLMCTKCDKSCKGHCRNGGPDGCEVCADGYEYVSNYGCLDIDECSQLESPPCQQNQLCLNTEGSYQCMPCDKACEGCTGDGPDMCVKCAEDYFLKDGFCVAKGTWNRELHIELARYATYAGLCIATFIIFRRNVWIASVIGLAVATYIGVSEYTLGGWDRISLGKTVRSALML